MNKKNQTDIFLLDMLDFVPVAALTPLALTTGHEQSNKPSQ